MSDLAFHFSNPWLLFLIIPALALTLIPFFLIPKKFRNTRNRVISVTLHSLVAVFLVTIIAGLTITFTVPNRENELMIVIDSSDSNTESAEAKEEYMQNIINMSSGYKVGIVTFGYDAVYAAPLSYDTQEIYEEYLASAKPDTTATNIADALKFASEKFTNKKTAKIVLLSDGFETDKDAIEQAQLIASQGIRIDTVNFPDESHADIMITDVETPTERIITQQDTKFELTVVSTNEEDVSATITVYDNDFDEVLPQPYTISPGEQKIEVTHQFDTAGMHDLIFEIKTTAGDTEDHLTQNNIYQSHVNITVFDNILIIENYPGEAQALYNILTEQYTNVETVNIRTDAGQLPTTAKELCAYEQVILVNISNADLHADTMPANFVESLYEYVYNLGGSLFTVGGENDTGADGSTVPHAYNPEDMNNGELGTLFQEMLPVQAIDYTPPTAVMLVIDSSGSMSGGKFPAAKTAAEYILDFLIDQQNKNGTEEGGMNSYCGVMTFNTSAIEQIQVLPVVQGEAIRNIITHLGEGESTSSGGTVFSGAIDLAGRALAAVDVPIKHIVLITDGNPDDHLEQNGANDNNWYGKYIDYNNENDISMSIVTIGADSGDKTTMEKAADRANGRYIDIPLRSGGGADSVTAMAGEITTFLQTDLQAVQQVEDEFIPTVGDQTSIFNGVDLSKPLPMLGGYYGTKLKNDDSVVSPLMNRFVPIYAAWNFGEGRVGSFMCDIGGKWSGEFVSSETGILIIKNICESLGPVQELEPDKLDFTIRETTQNYTNRIDVYTDLDEGQSVDIDITVISTNSAGQSANVNYMDGVPVEPLGDDSVSFNFSIAYTGLYRIVISKVDAQGNVIAKVTTYRHFSYSDEYDSTLSAADGAQLLSDIASNGNGEVIEDPVQIFATFVARLSRTFDPALTLLIISAVFILLDIAVRKFKFKWLHEIIRDRKALKEMNDSTNNQGGKAD